MIRMKWCSESCESVEIDLPIVEPLYTNYPPSALLSRSDQLCGMDLYPNTTRKISFYIHVPFCSSICPFCHLLTIASNDKNLMKKYVSALTHEIELVATKLKSSPTIDAMLFGGGTPSYIDPRLIDVVLKSIKTNFRVSSDCEITIECHPHTLTEEKLSAFYQSGINRLSVGVQSLDPTVLQSCARNYSYDDIVNMTKQAYKIGFENMNMDLMWGLPKQAISSVKDTCAKVLLIRPQQISIYSMTLGARSILRTLLRKKAVTLPTESERSKMYDIMYKTFIEAGYELPTVNNFVSDKKFVNKYAFNNWTSIVDRIGIGIGAYSFCHNHQYKNHENLDDYFACIEGHHLPIAHTVAISPEESLRRKIIFNLQNTVLDKTKFGFDIETLFANELKHLEERGFITNLSSKAELTYIGMKYLYYVQREFFSTTVRMGLENIGAPK